MSARGKADTAVADVTEVAEVTAVTEEPKTTAALNAAVSTQVNKLEAKRKGLVQAYKNEPQVQVTGSPMYRPYFGNTMTVNVNGICVCVPLDGTPYNIPETFAGVFKQRLHMVDEHITIRNQLANVQQNVEAYAGEKSLISRA